MTIREAIEQLQRAPDLEAQLLFETQQLNDDGQLVAYVQYELQQVYHSRYGTYLRDYDE